MRRAVVCAVLLSFAVCAPAQDAPVLAGCEPDYPPYCIVTEDGKADGFSVELLRAALASVGRASEFKTDQWRSLMLDLAEGRLQALPILGRTPEREAVYDFTFPYITMHGALVVRTDNREIRGPEDLRGRRVAVLSGDYAEEYLLRSGLGAVIAPRPSFKTALLELSAGQHDAVAIQKLVAMRIMQDNGITNLTAVGPPLFIQNFCFAVRKGDSSLLAELNEGLSVVMADGSFRQLFNKWLAAPELVARARRRIVVGGDADYAPYEFLDGNGRPTGMGVELTRAIAERLGLAVEIRLGKWSDVRRGLENGEIDLVQGMFYSYARSRSFEFSPPYTVVQHAIATRKDSPPLRDMAALKGKSILVMAGDIMHDVALQHGYGAQLALVDTQEEALAQLAAGKHDCALVAMLPALNWIRQNKWRNLRLSDEPVFSAEYCYAVRKGNQELLALFGEGLAAVKETGQYRWIWTMWLGPYETQFLDLRRLVQAAIVILVPLLALFLASLLWSRSLKRQVAARTSELTFKNALLNAQSEASLDGILAVSDGNGRILSANKRFVEMWNMSPELIRQGLSDTALLMAAEQTADPMQFMERARSLYADREATGRDEIELKDGRVFDLYSGPIRGEDGRCFGRVWYFRDITSRKRVGRELEEKIAESQRLLEDAAQSRRALLSVVEDEKAAHDDLRALSSRQDALLSAIPDIIMQEDANGVYTWTNPAGLDFFGPDCIGRKNDFFLDGSGGIVIAARPLSSVPGSTVYSESWQRRKDGRKRLLAWWRRELKNESGEVTGALSTARDITDQREMEQRLYNTQKIESVGRLAGGMAHDFNNMLLVIIGYVTIALDRLNPADQIHSYLVEIRKAAERSAELTRQLLAFARKQVIAPKVLDLNAIIEAMLKMLRQLIGEEIDLIWLPGEKLWPVKMDPSQVSQVLTNLCINSRDAIQGSGKVTIATQSASFDAGYCAGRPGFEPGDFARLSVSDDGVGMDKETVQKLFEPFFTTKDVGKGTGLGLSTVYGIVKQNRGFIDVQSEPGRGTTFSIYLPRADDGSEQGSQAPFEQEPAPEAARQPPPRSETVLLVEDDPAVLNIVSAILKDLGHTVLSAASPAEAIAMVEKNNLKFGLLVSDVIMPGMDGGEMAARLERFCPGFKRLFISGYSPSHIAARIKLSTESHFLAKPFNHKQLTAKLREILSEK